METKLIRNCSATAIPAGTAATLEKGTSVLVTQTLGGNVTVRTDQGLFRIASVDVDALEEIELGEGGDSSQPSEDSLEDQVWGALKQCYDPEIPINIVDLGLVYDLRVEPDGSGQSNVFVKMTLTAQGCGMGPVIAEDARTRIQLLDEVKEATVDIVWDPVWSPQMISEEGRKVLGIE
ncbi:iron-sulfur cluster assembly protein [Pelagicoccus sp. SDUM812003]|uniref:iron-sulfur cluster assembly protein n=1 Tax=Pelagicoccus sp. SDUM812003 TaxID=3041267 RepID=UPI0028100024|nr:iron-sulfur cluster assembly protein [Pelagicoccus sp. SDUM812003]MDQ8202889.1 iron-sulfur cluster assembly protein [Pelagicoccus sp. SDUM812003]